MRRSVKWCPIAALGAWFATTLALAQPAPEPPPAPAPAGPAATPPAFELREAPEPTLTGKEALAAQPGGLTADQVAERALASSPTLAARQAEIDAAAAKVDDAVAQFLPRLKLTASYRRVSPVDASLGGAIVGAANAGPITVGPCPDPALGADCALDSAGLPIGAAAFEFPSLVNNYSLNASLALPISDYVLRLSDTLAATRFGRRAAKIQKRAAALKIASDARLSYYNWLRASAGVAVAKSSLARFAAMLKDARIAYTLGAATKADVLRLEAALAATELAIAETETLRQLAEEQLAVMMDEPARRYQVGENVLANPSPRAEPPVSALIAEAYRRRLELQALRTAARSLRAGSRAARVSEWPRLDAFGDFTYANPNPVIFPQQQAWNESWAVGLALGWTVNDAFAGRAGAAELEANHRKLEADRRSLERGIKLQVVSAHLELRKARTAIKTAARGQAAAQEAYRVARDLYRVGRATTTDLMEAESDLVAASLKEVNAVLDYHSARVKLRYAVGRNAEPAS